MQVTKIEKNIDVHCLDGGIPKLIHVDNLIRCEAMDGCQSQLKNANNKIIEKSNQ